MHGRLVDDLGGTVALAGTPRRVVSLVPSLTEAVARTVPGVLVGATDWCTRPAGLAVTRVRGPRNPDTALIRRLRPDLVVASREENRRADVERLRAGGIAVWVTRIDGIDDAIARLGRLFATAFGLGHPPGWLDGAREVWFRPPRHPGLRAAVPVWRDPWRWVGDGTYAHDALSRLGWVNVAADLGGRYPSAAVATIHARRPDVALLPDEPYAFSADDSADALPGVRSVGVPGRALFWYGPAMVAARARLEAAVVDAAAGGVVGRVRS